MTTQHPAETLIVACDVPSVPEAVALATAVRPYACALKLGLEFFIACGPEGVAAVQQCGMPIFLDLKLHDIPNTVAHAMTQVTRMGIWMCTLHASGGVAMLQTARQAAHTAASTYGVTPPLCVAVTVLTSLSPEEVTYGMGKTPREATLHAAGIAEAAGMDGVVCAADDVSALGAAYPTLPTIVPGVRPAWYTTSDDQRRTATPAQARGLGATYLVVGRPITTAASPADAARDLYSA